jgi:hypothetical protein
MECAPIRGVADVCDTCVEVFGRGGRRRYDDQDDKWRPPRIAATSRAATTIAGAPVATRSR